MQHSVRQSPSPNNRVCQKVGLKGGKHNAYRRRTRNGYEHWWRLLCPGWLRRFWEHRSILGRIGWGFGLGSITARFSQSWRCSFLQYLTLHAQDGPKMFAALPGRDLVTVFPLRLALEVTFASTRRVP